MTTIQHKLDERYGRTSRRTVRIGLGIAIGIAAVVVIAYSWMTFVATAEQVDADTTGFELVDERTVEVAFQITAPTGRTVACILEAQDTEHGIVGWKVVEYEASDLTARAFRETIPTTAEATTGLVNSCWVT